MMHGPQNDKAQFQSFFENIGHHTCYSDTHLLSFICYHTNGWASQVETCLLTVRGAIKPFRGREALGFVNHAEFPHVRC